MKKGILVLAVAMMANIAQAKVSCSIAKETQPGSSTYDKLLYVGTIEKNALILLSPEGKATVVTNEFPYQQMAANNGNLFFSVSSVGKGLTIASGRLDLSKENITSTKSMMSVPASQDAVYFLAEETMIVCK